MAFSGEVWVLNKIADLASRFGVSPTIANVELLLHFPDEDSYHYTLSMLDGAARGPHEADKVAKVSALLGLDKQPFREFATLSDVEDAVDQALSLAPRARLR